jgi:hypothetical protein
MPCKKTIRARYLSGIFRASFGHLSDDISGDISGYISAAISAFRVRDVEGAIEPQAKYSRQPENLTIGHPRGRDARPRRNALYWPAKKVASHAV